METRMDCFRCSLPQQLFHAMFMSAGVIDEENNEIEFSAFSVYMNFDCYRPIFACAVVNSQRLLPFN